MSNGKSTDFPCVGLTYCDELECIWLEHNCPCLLQLHFGPFAGGQAVNDVKSQLPYFFLSDPYISSTSSCITCLEVD